MKDLKQHLTESSEKNLHLEHLEDQVLNRGVDGAREALSFLVSLRNMLSGHVKNPINITTKWDGAPAVVCGINPENGKFFVGTKSVFAMDSKRNYTEKDIDNNHPGEGLNYKLKMCLRYLPKLGIKGILQGDLMFTKGDTKLETIEGEKYVTFTPNTITYAIPAFTPLAARISGAALGIVFHTEYHGTTMSTLKTSFRIDLGHLVQTKDVWFRDASFVDESGVATFTIDEMGQLNARLDIARNILQALNGKILNQIALNETYRNYIKQFNNTKIRAGEAITNTSIHTNELIRWIDATLSASIRDAKLPATKTKRIAEKTLVVGFLRAHVQDLKMIFDLQNSLVYAKMMVVHKLNQVQSTHTFLKTSDGYQSTSPEGFVAIDRIGNAVKLVDRLTFSRANFSAAKDWR